MKLTHAISTCLAALAALSLISARADFVPLPPNTPETPGLSLSATNGLTGTVISDQTIDFSFALNPYSYTGLNVQASPVALTFRGVDITIPSYLINRYLAVPGTQAGWSGSPIQFPTQGKLRSLVVDNGGLRDYYYQLSNTSAGPDIFGDLDIFRLTFGGFLPNEVLSVSYRTDGLAGLVGAGTWVTGSQPPATADRGGTTDIGFDFPTQPPIPFTGSANCLNFGEVSNFLVISSTL